MSHSGIRIVGLGLMLVLVGRAAGQADVKVDAGGAGDVPAWVAQQIQNPDDPRVKEYAKRQKSKKQLEKELFKIRHEFIHNIKKTELRQIGIHKIRSYTQPYIYESLVTTFEKEGDDVRQAVFEHLADQKNDEADTTIAWFGVFGKRPETRADATSALKVRLKDIKSGDQVSNSVKTVVAQGLRSGDNKELSAAAGLAQQLKLVEAIPMMINAQVQGQQVATGGGNGDDGRSLAWIQIGTQQAFVSDLTPVVGDSAVAFDPTVSVITSGTVLRIVDAVVVTYQVDVHNSLIALSSDAWGQPTHKLGWDQVAWRTWYKDEFKPFLAKQADEKRTAAKAEPAR
jgi:hypothetical protein